MEKRKISLIVLLTIIIMVSSFNAILFVNAVGFKRWIKTEAYDGNYNTRPQKDMIHWGTNTERVWIVFANTTNKRIYLISGVEEDNGTSLSGTLYNLHAPADTGDTNLDAWLESRGSEDYMHIVTGDSTSENGGGTGDCFYKLIKLNDNGSYTNVSSEWVQIRDTVGNAEIMSVHVHVDKDGRDWLAVLDNGDAKTYIYMNEQNDGTWVNEAGFPHALITGGTFFYDVVLGLGNRRALVITHSGGIETLTWYFDGNNWDDVVDLGDDTYPYGLTVMDNGDVLIAGCDALHNTLDLNIFDVSTGIWGGWTTVRAGITDYMIKPIIRYTSNGDWYMCWSDRELDNLYWLRSNDTGITWTNQAGVEDTPQLWDGYGDEGLDDLSFCMSPSDEDIHGGWIFGLIGCDNDKFYMESLFDTTFTFIEEELYEPELLNITINGFVDGDYLFEGEVYEIDSYWNNTDYCYFQLNDTEHVWEYFYYNESQYMGIDVADFEGLITNELVVGCSYVYINDSFTGINENLTRLKWKFILNTQVVDCFNRTLSYYGENQQGNVTSGDTIYDEINIYNLGGYVTYDIVGDAGRLTKGDAWELWAENGTMGNPSYAYAETIFRKLQHVHFLVEIDLDLEWNSGTSEFDYDGGGFVEYGFDYRISQVWVTGWKVRLYPSTLDVGNHAGGSDHNWIQWAVEWYYNDTKVKEEIIYSNCYGYDHVSSNHGYTNRTSTQLWIDLWFNKMNASTVVGGRVNSYYYGTYERGTAWFGYGAFVPMFGDIDASMYFDDLKDIDGIVFTCQKLEIIRAWAKVTKIDDADSQDNRWEIKNYEILNWLLAQDRMMGTDTPVFVQTKILEVTTQHGFIQSLYIAITNLGATIWKGALGFTKIFIGAIDSLLMFLGLPEGTFTSLTQMIMMQFTQFLTWMTYLVAQVSNMLSVFSSMILFVLQIITNTVNAILWIFENAIAFPINVMKLMVAILNGETITLWGRLWDFTSAYGFIEAGKQMLPISIGIMFMFWLLYGNVQGEGDEDLYGFPRRVLDMFGWFKEIYQNVFFIFNRIRNELISMYNFIRSHIPSMGGGGGETEE